MSRDPGTTGGVEARDAGGATEVAPGRAGRDRYIDSLRVLALVRVMTYHTFGWAWLPLVFPSMQVMFALAGSLMATSLTRAPHGHYGVIHRRLHRLLPPVWVLGLVLVPLMLAVGGWDARGDGEPLRWKTMLLWLLPIGTPPGDAGGYEWVEPLWYIRSYLWFVLLSPSLLWLFRRWPLRTTAFFPAVCCLYTLGLVDLFGRLGDTILNAAIFGACWVLGFAHHDGVVRRTPLRVVLPAAAALMAVGAGFAFADPDPATGWDIDNIPLADCLYGLGFVLVLLRLYPSFTWMTRFPVLDAVVHVANSRAMTIYLWGNFAIAMSTPLLDHSPFAPYYDEGWRGMALQYSASWLLVVVAVLAVGWVEDVAARRAPRLLPWPRHRAPQVRQVRPVRDARPVRDVHEVRTSAGLSVTAQINIGAGVIALCVGAALWSLSDTPLLR